jgi:hypothetical protein
MLGVALAAAFASVLPERRDGDDIDLLLVAVLWFAGIAAGTVGAWWSHGNFRRTTSALSICLAMSAARTIGEMIPRSTGRGALIAAAVGAVSAAGMSLYFRAIGRANPDLTSTPVTWRPTGRSDEPFAATVDGELWLVRINEAPGAAPYTLVIGDDAVLELDRWPDAWRRDYAR